MARRKLVFEEELFPYDGDEYDRWNRRDESTIDGLLARCGPLGRTRSTYFNQTGDDGGGQNYPELRYGVHLVEECAFPREGVVYENYLLSAKSIAERQGKSGLYIDNTAKLERALSPAFFEEFDRLCSRNSSKIGKQTRHHMNVDLFAVNHEEKRLGFYEVKKYSPRKTKTELVQIEQLLALAFIRHLVDTAADLVFREGAFEVETKVIALAERQDIRLLRVEAKRHEIEFSV